LNQRRLESTLDPCNDPNAITNSVDWCRCIYNDSYMQYAYDPRCRSWYMNSYRDRSKVILSAPYQSDFGELIYITFSRYFNASAKDFEAVAAVDINMNWHVYHEVLADLTFIDHFFLVDLNGNVI
jgi:hypothetical protein